MTEASPQNETGQAPVRRCIVCRNADRKRALLRFVVGPDSELYFDVRGKLSGRGINVCGRRSCLEKAAAGAFKRGARGAKVTLPTDPGEWIEAAVVGPLQSQYRELVSLGRRSGQLLSGATQVERASREERLVAYLIASDASEGTRAKYRRNAERKELPTFGLLDRTELGRCVGRDEAVVLGWVTGPLVKRFAEIERHLVSVTQDASPA